MKVKKPPLEFSQETHNHFLGQDSSLDKKELVSFIKKSVYEGVPSCLTYGDYCINTLIAKLLFSKSGDLDLLSSTSFSNTYMALNMSCVCYGVTEAFGVTASRAFGRGKWAKVNFKLKQSIIAMWLFLLVIFVLPSFYIRDILIASKDVLNLNDQMINNVVELVRWSIIPAFVRGLNMNIKTMF